MKRECACITKDTKRKSEKEHKWDRKREGARERTKRGRGYMETYTHRELEKQREKAWKIDSERGRDGEKPAGTQAPEKLCVVQKNKDRDTISTTP